MYVSRILFTLCFDLIDKWVLFCCCLGGGEGEAKQGGKKKFITRDEEPEQ